MLSLLGRRLGGRSLRRVPVKHFSNISNPTPNAPTGTSTTSTGTPTTSDGEQTPEGEQLYMHKVSVDRRGLYKSNYDQPAPGSKPPTTPLIDDIKMTIGVKGSRVDWV